MCIDSSLNPLNVRSDTGVNTVFARLRTAFAPADHARLGPAGGATRYDQWATAVTLTRVFDANLITGSNRLSTNSPTIVPVAQRVLDNGHIHL